MYRCAVSSSCSLPKRLIQVVQFWNFLSGRSYKRRLFIETILHNHRPLPGQRSRNPRSRRRDHPCDGPAFISALQGKSSRILVRFRCGGENALHVTHELAGDHREHISSGDSNFAIRGLLQGALQRLSTNGTQTTLASSKEGMVACWFPYYLCPNKVTTEPTRVLGTRQRP